MNNVAAKVVSRSLTPIFGAPISGKVIADEMAKLLTYLGQNLNYKGKIIGHLKIMAEVGEDYLQMSMTSFPDITVKSCLVWSNRSFQRIDLTCNIIVIGHEKNRLEMLLQEGLSSSIFVTQS